MIKEVCCIDYAKWMRKNKRKVRCLFADPPDNLGLKYKGFKDNSSSAEYEDMLRHVLVEGSQIAPVIWLSLNTRYSPLIGKLTYDFLNYNPDWEFKPCVQTFTFGNYQSADLTNNHRLLYRYMRKGTGLYTDGIRVPSWRQLNGDKRADPRGCVPGDVFAFPRVTGNSKQRRDYSPTQLHESLYERCIKLTCRPGSLVVDLFAGSGTLGRVADRCKVRALMLEISRETCDSILKDQPDAVEMRCR